MEKEVKKPFEATEQQIKEWKEKYASVFQITVEDKAAYLRRPNRNDLSYASTVGMKDPMKFNEIILKNCWLAGDEEIKTDDRLFMGASSKLDVIIETAEAEIKKL